MALAIAAPRAEARYASIVIDAGSGQVLHETNADTRNYPASLTKMMTLYMTFEALKTGRLRLDQKLKVSRRAEGISPSKLGLKRGETITVKAVILALITKSANDAAVVIAEELGGTEIKFALMMTAKAKQLGMTRTNFRNASGLPNRRQLSTARDMATLAKALLRDHPKYYDYFATQKFTYRDRTYRNHNKLLNRYEGTDGIKTGYIRASGFNLVASVERDGRRLIAVVFGGKSPRSRDAHMVKLLDRGFTRVARGLRQVPPPPQRNPLYPGSEPIITAGGPATAAKALTAAAESEVVAKPQAPEAKGRKLVVARLPTPPAPPEPGRAVATPAPAEALQRAWGIQVGAYSSFAPAHQAATKAARSLPAILLATKPVIRQMNLDSGRVYRAQLSGLTELRAREACRKLAKLSQGCVVVPPSSPASALTLSESG